MADETTENYKMTGMRSDIDGSTAARISTGTTVTVGVTAALTSAEVEELKGAGVVLRKQKADGTDEDDEGDAPATKAEQQKAQVASGAQHPAANPAKDNTPAARSGS